MTKRNLAVAEWLKRTSENVKVVREKNVIKVFFEETLVIPHVDLAVQIGISIEEWRVLAREIKETLENGRLHEHGDEILSIRPLRTESLHIRLTPVEDEFIRRAAEFKHATLSEFVRRAILNAAEEVIRKKQSEEGV